MSFVGKFKLQVYKADNHHQAGKLFQACIPALCRALYYVISDLMCFSV